MTLVSIIRSSNTVALVPEAKISFAFSRSPSLLRLTARRAATIEPRIQAPPIKIRALKQRPKSNSTLLSTIRASMGLQWYVTVLAQFLFPTSLTILYTLETLSLQRPNMHDVYSSHRVFLLLKTKLQKGYLVTLRKSVRTAVSSLLVGALLALMGCGSSKATLRVLNATPNESQIDVSLDSTSFATSVSYGTATGYSSVTSGSRDLEIYPSGVTTAYINATIDLSSGSTTRSCRPTSFPTRALCY